MGFDRFIGNEEFLSDLIVAQAAFQQEDNLLFPAGDAMAGDKMAWNAIIFADADSGYIEQRRYDKERVEKQDKYNQREMGLENKKFQKVNRDIKSFENIDQ
jgi:hypothetical protein